MSKNGRKLLSERKLQSLQCDDGLVYVQGLEKEPVEKVMTRTPVAAELDAWPGVGPDPFVCPASV